MNMVTPYNASASVTCMPDSEGSSHAESVLHRVAWAGELRSMMQHRLCL